MSNFKVVTFALPLWGTLGWLSRGLLMNHYSAVRNFVDIKHLSCSFSFGQYMEMLVKDDPKSVHREAGGAEQGNPV